MTNKQTNDKVKASNGFKPTKKELEEKRSNGTTASPRGVTPKKVLEDMGKLDTLAWPDLRSTIFELEEMIMLLDEKLRLARTQALLQHNAKSVENTSMKITSETKELLDKAGLKLKVEKVGEQPVLCIQLKREDDRVMHSTMMSSMDAYTGKKGTTTCIQLDVTVYNLLVGPPPSR